MNHLYDLQDAAQDSYRYDYAGDRPATAGDIELARAVIRDWEQAGRPAYAAPLVQRVAYAAAEALDSAGDNYSRHWEAGTRPLVSLFDDAEQAARQAVEDAQPVYTCSGCIMAAHYGLEALDNEAAYTGEPLDDLRELRRAALEDEAPLPLDEAHGELCHAGGWYSRRCHYCDQLTETSRVLLAPLHRAADLQFRDGRTVRLTAGMTTAGLEAALGGLNPSDLNRSPETACYVAPRSDVPANLRDSWARCGTDAYGLLTDLQWYWAATPAQRQAAARLSPGDLLDDLQQVASCRDSD